jgi:hypothetical protein
MTQFELDILTVFYDPYSNMDLCHQVNRPENLEARKVAIHKLLDEGLLQDLGGFNLKITHKGHTLLDDRKKVDIDL